MQTLQKALDVLTKASVESIRHRLLNFMACPLIEFNKYAALEMTEELQNAAHDRIHHKERYYRLSCVPDHKRENGAPTSPIPCPFAAPVGRQRSRTGFGHCLLRWKNILRNNDLSMFHRCIDPGSWCHTSVDEWPLLLL